VVLNFSQEQPPLNAFPIFILKDGMLFSLSEGSFLIIHDSAHYRAFDVELLYIAQQFKVPISEVSVRWTEIDGSKIVPVLSWLQMGRDLFLIWLRYFIGAWKLKSKED
jgi:hypothetical protein